MLRALLSTCSWLMSQSATGACATALTTLRTIAGSRTLTGLNSAKSASQSPSFHKLAAPVIHRTLQSIQTLIRSHPRFPAEMILSSTGEWRQGRRRSPRPAYRHPRRKRNRIQALQQARQYSTLKPICLKKEI